jgi:hypothetical protein
MAEDYLKPRGVDTKELQRRRMQDGQFINPPTYQKYGGFSSADRGKWQQNKMTLEKGGPQAVRGRPL